MKCLACGSIETSFYTRAKDVEYFTSDRQFSYFVCKECGSLSIDPVPIEQLSIIYPKNYYSFSPQKMGLLLRVKTFLDQLFFKKFLSLLKRKELKVLDVGGGEGWMLDVVKNTDSRVVHTQVVDIDDRAQALAQAKGHKYFCGRFEEFPVDQKYDLILMLNLIEHVSNPRAILEKAFQAMSEGGFLLIKTPNIESLDARLFKDLNWGGYHCPRHWVLFSMISLEKLAVSVGFHVEIKKYTQGSPFWTWSVLHWLHSKNLIKMSAEKPAFQHPLNPFLSLIFAAIDFLRVPFFKTSQMFLVLKR